MYELKTPDHEKEPVFVPGIPSAYSHHGIHNADRAFHVAEDYGVQLFQVIQADNFEGWCIDFDMRQNVTLYSSATKPALVFHLAVKGDFKYYLNGVGDTVLPESRFNFTYAPNLEGRFIVEKEKHYRYFELHPVYDILKELSEYFPDLLMFLDKVKSGDTIMLKEFHPIATPEMLAIVHQILYNRFEGPLKKLYLEVKAYEIVLLALHQSQLVELPPQNILLTDYEKEQLEEARSYLMSHLDEPIPISSLARMVGINTTKLKKAFKQRYNTTIFEFVMDLRMGKAMELLQIGNTPIQDIAFIAGYSNVSNFTNAFKKRFGRSPITFKRKNF